MAAVMAALSSPSTTWETIWQPNSASLAWMTGVNWSAMRPAATSLPVVTTPYRFCFRGSSRSRGFFPAACLARSIFSFSMTRGITRVPQSLSPFFTTKPLGRVAIIISPRLFTARRRSRSARNRPSHPAMSSIFPSLGSVASMFSPWQICRKIWAASFSWSLVSSFSQT